MPITPVILAGGSGKRLWPLSQEACPKQFLRLTESSTLLQSTLLRTVGRPEFGDPIVIASVEHRFKVADQMREIGVRPDRIVLEPSGRNTAPAAAVAAMILADADPHALILLMPSDHAIGEIDAFLSAVAAGAKAARDGALVLFGVQPAYPATGYGYIEAGDPRTGHEIRAVRRFIEKPTLQAAERYVASGFVWNSGMFLLPVGAFLSEVERLAPDVYAAARKAVDSAIADTDFTRLDPEAFAKAPSISVDHAIFEKTQLAAVIPVAMRWTDIGSWSAVWDIGSKDAAGNVRLGRVVAENAANSYLRSEGPLLAAIGVEDLIVVATQDAILVVDRKHDQDVRRVISRIEEKFGKLIGRGEAER